MAGLTAIGPRSVALAYALAIRLVQRRAVRNDLDDGLESGRLLAAFRVQVSGRPTPRVILDRHARRERHRLFLEAADVELVDRGLLVDQLALLLQDVLVVIDDLDKARVGAEQVIALGAAGGPASGFAAVGGATFGNGCGFCASNAHTATSGHIIIIINGRDDDTSRVLHGAPGPPR